MNTSSKMNYRRENVNISAAKFYLVSGLQSLAGIGLICSSVADLMLGYSGNFAYVVPGVWSGIVVLISASFGMSLQDESPIRRFKIYRILQIICTIVSIFPVLFGAGIALLCTKDFEGWAENGPGIDVGGFMAFFGLLSLGLSVWALIEYKRKITNALKKMKRLESVDDRSSTSNEYTNVGYESSN
ncbi:hypothetical protein QYM36_004779 [Artemia franciscana]|uniref:Uncharacterized protein n=1 Tax=Artemia franciscana TaxID=6661 RepID=A0AA88HVX9_ARTSF|nr:hypothetical protein QYM36_004779 [Artemia franciscana]